MKLIYLIILIALAYCQSFIGPVRAQNTDRSLQIADSIAKESNHKFSKDGFIGAPSASYEKETGWVGDLAGLYYFHVGPDTNEKLTRPSNVSAGVSYSQLHQYFIGVDYSLYASRDAYQLNGGFHYQEIPLGFYGVGNSSPVNAIDNYTPLYKGLNFNLTRSLFRGLFGEELNGGLEGEFRTDAILQSDSGGLIANNQVPGARGGTSNGLGARLIYDTRDNVYSTHEGQYESIDAEFYGRALGSDYSFSRYRFDLRRFIPLAENQTLAMQFYGTLSNGTVPFYEMSGLGGDSKLRGYYLLRFRDNDVALLQSEYRFPIWWQFGGVVFADAGEVGHVPSDFTYSGIHPSVGIGLRLLVIPEEHLSARVDYGIGTDSREIYVNILEVF